MGVSTVWHPAIVKHVCLSLFAWVVTNQWATKNSSTLTLHPGYALWDIPLFFQIEAKYLTCREQLQAKQLRQWLKLMKTLYMLCYAMHRWTGTKTHHIRIADRQGAVWYIILDLHCSSCSCGKTSMYYVVAFSWSPVSAKGVQRRWR